MRRPTPYFLQRNDRSHVLVLPKRGSLDVSLPDTSFPDSTPELLVPLRCTYTPSGKEYVLPRDCASLITRLGLRPRFLLPGLHRVDAFPNAAGALYLGGADLDPDLYGARAHPNTEADELARDVLEISLLRERILPNQMPYFGICRGIQALAVAAGGTLYQHVPDIDVTVDHWGVSGEDATHIINVVSDTRCATLLPSAVTINSHHHQAVATPGRGMRIAGASPGGIAELLETVDPKHWCVATQSHPERDLHDALAPLLDGFAHAVRAYAGRKV